MASAGSKWGKTKSGKYRSVSGATFMIGGLDKQKFTQGELTSKEIATAEKKVLAHRKARKAKLIALQKTMDVGYVGQIKTTEIQVDPKRFQYKIMGIYNKSGSVGSLSSAEKWDDNLAGIIQVWRDPKDKKIYVVNGHNRLELAKSQSIKKINVKFLDAKSAQEARAIGALTNIAEGKGTALDAAKFFRDTNISSQELRAKGIPMKERIAKEGLALAKLDNSIFDKISQGNISQEFGIVIGEKELDFNQQQAVVKMLESSIAKKRNITKEQLTEFIDIAKSASTLKNNEPDLFSLLGDLNFAQSQTLALEKAGLQTQIKKRLASDKKLFKAVSKVKSAKKLESAGNRIDTQQTQKEASKLESIINIFDTFKNTNSNISSILNQGAQRINKGENKTKVTQDIYTQIIQELTILTTKEV